MGFFVRINAKFEFMNWHYWKLAWRSLLKKDGSLVLNVLGLAVSIASSLFLFSYTSFELSFDTYHSNHQNIYRITEEITSPKDHVEWAPVGGIYTAPLVDDVPEIKRLIRFSPSWGEDPHIRTEYNDSFVDNKKFFWVDPDVFETFDFKLIQGNKTSLKNRGSIAISERMAQVFFGNRDPLNETLFRNGTINLHGTSGKYEQYIVTAVFENIPSNSHFTFDFLANPNEGDLDGDWLYNYIQVNENSSRAAIQDKINQSFKKNNPDLFNDGHLLKLQSIADIHLHSAIDYEIQANGNYYYVLGAFIIGILILVAGLINYVNLSIIIGDSRKKEISVRLVSGGGSNDLLIQFVHEIGLQVLIALLIAALLIFVSLPLINQHFDIDLFPLLVNKAPIWGPVICLGAVAFVVGQSKLLSANRSISFQHSVEERRSGGSTLVIFQFAASIFVIIATLTVREQIVFMAGKELGFDKDQVLIVPSRGSKISTSIDVLKDLWLDHSEVLAVSNLSSYPGRFEWMGYPSVEAEGNEGLNLRILTNQTDIDVVDALGLSVLDGRNFTKPLDTDGTRSVLINESAVRMFGWKRPIGKKIKLSFDKVERTVIGVFENFHYRTLHFPVEPMALTPTPSGKPMIAIRTSSTSPDLIEFLEAKWNEFEPGQPFSYSFINNGFDKQYKEEKTIQGFFSIFSILSVIMSMIGLFALAIHTLQRRVKEVSIRKVLGATGLQLFHLLTSQFIKPALIAFVIIAPVAWLLLNRWLENFSYRIDLTFWPLALSLIIVLLMVILTISRVIIQLITTNPVDTLRYE